MYKRQPLISPRRGSTVCYNDSPLNAWPERSAAFAAGPEPGEVLPECPITLADGRRGYVTDWFTGGFTVLWFTDAGPTPGNLLAWADECSQRGVRCAAFGLAQTSSCLLYTSRCV